jgi:hypothetical protein
MLPAAGGCGSLLDVAVGWCDVTTEWYCPCCRFYETDSAIKIGMMEAFAKLAVDPDSLPDIIFASIGRTTWKVGVNRLLGQDGQG